MTVVVLALSLAALFVVVCVAIPKADFSGRWTVERCAFPGCGTVDCTVHSDMEAF